jgi:hypothetical protein
MFDLNPAATSFSPSGEKVTQFILPGSSDNAATRPGTVVLLKLRRFQKYCICNFLAKNLQ